MSEGRSARAVLRERPLLADALLALGLWLCEAVLWLLGPAEFHPRSWAFALPYSLVGMVSVALRRRYPWLAVTLLAVHTAAPFLGPPDLRQPEAIAIVVVTYTAAAYLPLRAAAVATALLWVPMV